MKKTLNILITLLLILTSIYSNNTSILAEAHNTTEEEEIISVTDIAFDKDDLILTVGETEQLTVTIEPEDATNKDVVWSSSNEEIITVDEEGNVEALNQGTATITVTTIDGEFEAELEVVVEEVEEISVEGISFDLEDLILTVGETEHLTVTIEPEDATNKEVIWSSSNEEIITVDEEGNVEALSEGTAVITVTSADSNHEAKLNVTVEEVVSVESVSFEVEDITLFIGESQLLNASIEPENATNKEVLWTTSNEAVVAVDVKGKIEALSEGTAVITLTSVDGNHEAKLNVTVEEVVSVESVSFEVEDITLFIGESQLLNASIEPENATNKEVLWTTSNEAVVAVDVEGKIEALSEGTAVITVTSVDGEHEAKLNVTVEVAVESIEINETKMNLKVGETSSISYMILPENATHQEVLWVSSNNSVVSVDQSGHINALKAGSATIVVTTLSGDVSASVDITVGQDITGITVNKNKLTLRVNESEKLIASIMPEDASNKTLLWKSSNNRVARVDQNGNVKAFSLGKATITVVSVNSGYEEKIEVDVVNTISSIEWNSVPKKSIYSINDDLDLQGAKISVIYEDGKKEIINVTEEMVMGFNSNDYHLGQQTLTVTYEEFVLTFDVYVNKFKDVKIDSSFYHYIYDLYNDEIIKGYDEDNTFRPNNQLTRAQAAKMIVESAGINTDGVNSDFKDVKKGTSQYIYISALVEAGVVDGYDDGTFRPNNPVTRAQIAKMVSEAFNLEKQNDDDYFEDVEKLSLRTREYIYKLSSNGIVKGYKDGFKPHDNVTRGQFTKIVSIAKEIE